MCPTVLDDDDDVDDDGGGYRGSLRYLISSQATFYQASVLDVRRLRCVHCVDHYPCLLDPQAISATTAECGAVHYGYCVPVMLDSCAEDGLVVVGAGSGIATATMDHHRTVTRLLASPTLDNNLKSLVNCFVAQDRATRGPSACNNGGNGLQTSKTMSTAATATAAASKFGYSKSANNVPDGSKAVNAVAFEVECEEKLGQLLLDLTVAVTPSASNHKKDITNRTVTSLTNAGNKAKSRSINSKIGSSGDDVEKQLMNIVENSTTTTTTMTTTTTDVGRVPGSIDRSGGVVKNKSSKTKYGKPATDDEVEKQLMQVLGPQPTVGTGVKQKPSGGDNDADDVDVDVDKQLDKDKDKHKHKHKQPKALRRPSDDVDDVERRLLDVLHQPTSAKSVQAVLSTLARDDGSGYILSPVDYAKRRFALNQSASAAAASTPAMALSQPLNGIPHLVSETKNRFENGLFPSHESASRWKNEWTSNRDNPAMINLAVPSTQQQQQQPQPQSQNSPSPEPLATNSPLPHPKLTSIQKQHIRERAMAPLMLAVGTNAETTTTTTTTMTTAATTATTTSMSAMGMGASSTAGLPIRPFLTKGSVAERVLIFERCPILDKGSNRIHQAHYPTKPLFNTWRTSNYDVSKPKNDGESRLVETTTTSETDRFVAHSSPTTRRSAKSKSGLVCNGVDNSRGKGSARSSAFTSRNRSRHIPRFYYPKGRPISSNVAESQLHAVMTAFGKLDQRRATVDHFCVITKACQLPVYWKMPLYLASVRDGMAYVTCEQFLDYWKRLLSACYDDATKFVYVLTKGIRDYVIPEDFMSLIQDVIDTHPGLTFLKEATEFHSRYVHTVIARIFYCTNRSWSGRISISELRKSNFLQVLSILEDEEDINQVTDYFSYEHFYVIYCKFWELDKDHDLFIDRMDLARHNDNAISSRMIERIFSGAVTRGSIHEEGKMGYAEFVWFLLSEEDKRYPTSIEYWFRCMDLDGDGYLSMYELEYFYEEQLQRMEALGIETLPFQDCLCQMLDMIQPNIAGKISLGDLKRCKMTPIFFDTFFNLEKYLDHEQRDPFASHRDEELEGTETSDWNRYAAEEYELLVAEEGAAEQQEDLLYDDDYEQDEEEIATTLERRIFDEGPRGHGTLGRTPLQKNANKGTTNSDVSSDDDYSDYAADTDDYQY